MQAAVHHHVSVMLEQSVDALSIQPDGCYVDGTFGRGGHSAAILQALNEQGRLIAFDQDPQAIAFGQKAFAHDPRFTLIHDNFEHLQHQLARLELMGKIDGILLDIGVSSPQLDQAERGFSFMKDGPLDMRMDTSQGLTALQLLQQTDAQKIAYWLRVYGEERHAKRLAKVMTEAAIAEQLETTLDLANLVEKTIGRREKKHPATRTFQALRIAVNRELEVLESVLDQALSALKSNGRLVVISFHSLEDRMVKQFMKAKPAVDPVLARLPVIMEQPLSPFSKVLKPVFATEAELATNVRSRSAVLRCAIKR